MICLYRLLSWPTPGFSRTLTLHGVRLCVSGTALAAGLAPQCLTPKGRWLVPDRSRIWRCPVSLRIFLLFSLITLANVGGGVAWGQLFGERSTGQPLQSPRARGAGVQAAGQGFPTPRAQGPAVQAGEADVGTLQGSERFLRENRSRDAFVGSDQRSLGGFVGSEQALGVGRVQTATETLSAPPDESRRINRPLPPLPDGAMYYPRLVLGDEFKKAAPAANSQQLNRDQALEERLAKHIDVPIQVLRQGDRAILRGTVASQEIADRLKLLISFEPQIYRIEDQLKVVASQ